MSSITPEQRAADRKLAFGKFDANDQWAAWRRLPIYIDALDAAEQRITELEQERGSPWCRHHEVPTMTRPKVVCLCGSTRFWETFRDVGLELTLAGVIVLSIGICAPDSMVLANPESEEGKAQRRRLDELHKRKIDLADEVLVLDVDGYIGQSTRGEIEYADRHGKPVRWLSKTGVFVREEERRDG